MTTILECRVAMQDVRVGDMIQLALVPAGSRIGLVRQDSLTFTTVFHIESPEYNGEQEVIGVELLRHFDWRETHWPRTSGAREPAVGERVMLMPPALPILERKRRRINLVDIAAA